MYQQAGNRGDTAQQPSAAGLLLSPLPLLQAASHLLPPLPPLLLVKRPATCRLGHVLHFWPALVLLGDGGLPGAASAPASRGCLQEATSMYAAVYCVILSRVKCVRLAGAS